MSVESKYKIALNFIQNLPADGPVKPSNNQKLAFYALHKQATVGKCNTKAPSRLKLVDHAKWSAWNALGNISKEDAMKKYVDELNKIYPKWEELASKQAPKAKL